MHGVCLILQVPPNCGISGVLEPVRMTRSSADQHVGQHGMCTAVEVMCTGYIIHKLAVYRSWWGRTSRKLLLAILNSTLCRDCIAVGTNVL